MAQKDWDVVDVRLAALEAKWSGMELGRVLGTFRCSRSQLFEWQARYRAEGVAGLEPRSRRPLSSPRRTPVEVEDAVLVIAKARPRWGPDKIRAELVRTAGAASGVSDLLCKGSVGLRGTRWTLWLMNRLRLGQMSLRS